jgi:ankyrin repeat protein
VPPLTTDYAGNTPLSLVARSHHKEAIRILKLLLSRKFTIDLKDRWRWTPLLRGCRSGNAEAVSILLENVAKRDTKTNNGFNALHMATVLITHPGKPCKRSRIVHQLVQNGLNPLELNEQQFALLHYALVLASQSFVLNAELGLEDIPPFPRTYWSNNKPKPWLNRTFRLFRRRIPEERFKRLVQRETGKA